MTEPSDLSHPTDGAARSVRSAGELAEKLDISIAEWTAERVVGSMPVEGNRQPYGLLHGGASAVLAETLGSLHAALLAPEGKVPVGTDLNCTHHRGKTGGTVHGVSTVAHAGRSMASLEVVLTDESGRRICTARLSCAFIDARRPLPPLR